MNIKYLCSVCFFLLVLLITGCKDEADKKENAVEPDTIKYYRSIIDTTKTADKSRKALFMICYLYFHNIKDTAKARDNMNKFLKMYPDADNDGTTESVRIMLEALNSK